MTGLRPPLSYYGGKQNLASTIVDLIPAHQTYVEPFFGGGAVFWEKPASSSEFINDVNGLLITFYRVLQLRFDELKQEIDCTLHSRTLHKRSATILKNSLDYSEVEIAWAVWYQCNGSFAKKIFGGFGYSHAGDVPGMIAAKKNEFSLALSKRLKNTHIDCQDALKLFDLLDSKETFFYVDPPYVSSDQGHYKGYTNADFNALLDKLANIKGSFLLSSYPDTRLIDYRCRYGWSSKDITQRLSVNGKREEKKKKIECMTMNYSVYKKEMDLFDI